jgi:hypothetical protein
MTVFASYVQANGVSACLVIIVNGYTIDQRVAQKGRDFAMACGDILDRVYTALEGKHGQSIPENAGYMDKSWHSTVIDKLNAIGKSAETMRHHQLGFEATASSLSRVSNDLSNTVSSSTLLKQSCLSAMRACVMHMAYRTRKLGHEIDKNALAALDIGPVKIEDAALTGKPDIVRQSLEDTMQTMSSVNEEIKNRLELSIKELFVYKPGQNIPQQDNRPPAANDQNRSQKLEI